MNSNIKKTIKFFSIILTLFFAIGFANVAQAAQGDVLINEFVTDPSGANEWYELLNTTVGDIDLTGWTINRSATSDALPLSGTLPARGILVFSVAKSPANNAGDVLALKDAATADVFGVSYGSLNPPVIPHSAAPATDNSAYISDYTPGAIVFSTTATPSKGWFNDAGQPGKAPLLSTIDSDLLAGGIDSNIGELANPSATPATEGAGALSFEKVGRGKMVFEKVLNLTDQNTVAVLQNLGTAMEISDGHMAFDSTTAAAMDATGAKIYMYGMTLPTTPTILVDGVPANIGVDVEGISYGAGTLAFTAKHFTSFDVLTTGYVRTDGDDTICNGSANVAKGAFVGTNQPCAVKTITKGISQVSAGGTLNVAAGTYAEDILIDKELTIRGAEYNVDPADAGSGWTGSTVIVAGGTSGAGLPDYAGYSPHLKHSDITFQGFKVMSDGTPRPGLYVGGDGVGTFDNINISYCELTGRSEAGIILGAMGGTVLSDMVIDHVYAHDNATGNGIKTTNVGNPTITNSKITNNGATGAIDENQYGLWIGATNSAVVIPATITGNTFSGNQAGSILFKAHSGNNQDTTGTVVSGNVFNEGGAKKGVNNAIVAAHQINATSNYWGSAVLATVISRVSSDVTFKPYYIDEAKTTQSTAKAITAFTIPGQTGSTTINEGAHTIGLTMPYGTDVTALVATFTTTGSAVAIGAVPQVSATTANDFTGALTYTVTSVDEDTTQDYVVTVSVALNPAKAITAYSFAALPATGVINEGAHTIAVNVPNGTDVTALVATFTITGDSIAIGITPQVSTVTANNFTSAVTYVVTAADATTQEYVVTVHINPPAPVITSVATDGYINNSEKAAIHVIGTAQANSLVTVTLTNGANSKTGTQQLTGGATAYDITIDGTAAAPAGLADGTIDVGATATNSFGGTSTTATTTATQDISAPTVTKIGDNSADVTIAATATADLVFNEALSASGKTAVQNALTAGADKTITYGWNGGNDTLTITGHATDVTTFVNDVMATVTDVAGNSATLLLIDSKLDADQTAPDGGGAATINNTTPEVVISNPSQAVTVTITGGTTAPMVDVSSLISGVTGTLPAITIDSSVADVTIPATTVITGPVGWNGIIQAPVSGTPAGGTPPAGFSVGSTVISVGSPDGTITFDKAITILLPGVTGTVGYRPSGSSNWQTITATCGGTYANPTDPAPGGECSINNGVDTKIVTFHFTSFGSLNAVISGGGGGSSVQSAITPPTGGFTIKINNGATSTLTTDVTLTLNGGTEAVKMAIVNGDNFTSATQETYATTKSWTLPSGNGLKTVCVRFYNTAGYYSSSVCTSIYLGNPPAGATTTNIGQITGTEPQTLGQLISITRFGENSANVRALQQHLKNLGYFTYPTITGYYGAVTKAAIKAYQDSLSTGSTTTTLSSTISTYLASLSKPLNQMNRDELINVLLRLLILTRFPTAQ